VRFALFRDFVGTSSGDGVPDNLNVLWSTATRRQRTPKPPRRPQNNKSKKAPFSQGLFVSCAGAIRSMYPEVFSTIRVELAA
jgi:hypothetical protein